MSRRSTRPRTFSRRGGRRTPAGTPGSFDFELLESRTLLAGTPLSSVQAGAIVQGLQALVSAGARVDSQAQVISDQLPVLVGPARRPGGATSPVSIGMIASLGNYLNTSL